MFHYPWPEVRIRRVATDDWIYDSTSKWNCSCNESVLKCSSLSQFSRRFRPRNWSWAETLVKELISLWGRFAGYISIHTWSTALHTGYSEASQEQFRISFSWDFFMIWLKKLSGPYVDTMLTKVLQQVPAIRTSCSSGANFMQLMLTWSVHGICMRWAWLQYVWYKGLYTVLTCCFCMKFAWVQLLTTAESSA